MVILFCGLAGCDSDITRNSTQTAMPMNPEVQIDSGTLTDIDCVFDKLAPASISNEIYAGSGNGSGAQPFSLNSTTNLRVYWTQSTKDTFGLSIVNLDPSLAGKIEKTTTLESFVGPSSGCVDTTLGEGDYQLVISETEGSWKVWVEAIEY